MGITVEVYRGAGDRIGAEIVEPLLGSSTAAALSLGRSALDAAAHQRLATTLELVAPRTDLSLGDLVAISDPAQGPEWRGKIVGIQHTTKLGAAPTTLTIERPIDD
jgi:hypothetical protein